MRAFVLLDPCQDYEEDTDVLGVYFTLSDALAAGGALQAEEDGRMADRMVSIEEWDGATKVATWTRKPSDHWRTGTVWS